MRTIRKRVLFLLLVSINLSQISLFADGNMQNFEQGTAMYRSLASDLFSTDHWHNGLFLYFYTADNNGIITGHIKYAEQGKGTSSSGAAQIVDKEEFLNTNTNNINSLKQDVIVAFKDEADYHGAYSKIIQPNTLQSIVSTAYEVIASDPAYCWEDMIKSEMIWIPIGPNPGDGFYLYTWDFHTEVAAIHSMRCDGVTEYCYEKNSILVARNDFITSVGMSHLDNHNDFHNYDYNVGELCPKIQAGGLGNDTEFTPLLSEIPEIYDFSSSTTAIESSLLHELNFKISDNASVKAYVLIQVRETGNTDWHTLKDTNDNIWNFKEVDLTDYSNGDQYDEFYITWLGEYEGGTYNTFLDFDLKITVVDQGANYNAATLMIPFYPPVITNSLRGNQDILLEFQSGCDGVKIYYDTNSGHPYNGTGAVQGNSPIIYEPNSDSTFVLCGLTNGTTYYIAMKSWNSTLYQESSEYSNEKIATPLTLSGTLTQSESWPGLGNPANITLEGNVIIPAGDTLTLNSGTIINLNNYYIKSNGGIIEKYSNVTLNPDIRVVNGTTLKGQYPTVQSALADATSSDEVQIYTSSNLSGQITVPCDLRVGPYRQLTIAAGSILTFASGKKLIVQGILEAVGGSSTRVTLTSNSSWEGVWANGGDWGDASVDLTWTDIFHATYGLHLDYNTETELSHCRLQYNETGIYAYGGANVSVSGSSGIMNNEEEGIFGDFIDLYCSWSMIQYNGGDGCYLIDCEATIGRMSFKNNADGIYYRNQGTLDMGASCNNKGNNQMYGTAGYKVALADFATALANGNYWGTGFDWDDIRVPGGCHFYENCPLSSPPLVNSVTNIAHLNKNSAIEAITGDPSSLIQYACQLRNDSLYADAVAILKPLVETTTMEPL